jgi:hypothetical protein
LFKKVNCTESSSSVRLPWFLYLLNDYHLLFQHSKSFVTSATKNNSKQVSISYNGFRLFDARLKYARVFLPEKQFQSNLTYTAPSMVIHKTSYKLLAIILRVCVIMSGLVIFKLTFLVKGLWAQRQFERKFYAKLYIPGLLSSPEKRQKKQQPFSHKLHVIISSS